jgi:hypothetical protein
VLAAIASALHLRPLILWALEIEPALRLEAHAERLHVPTLVAFAAPPQDWVSLRIGNLSLEAPIPDAARDTCQHCIEHCLLQLESGTLAILPDRSPESYQEVLDTFGPDEQDLSPLRSAGSNWITIESIAARVVSTSPIPDSFRFEAPGSKGLATLLIGASRQTFVVYPYSHSGSAQRVIGMTGVERTDARRIIGSIVATSNEALEAMEREPSSDCR